jgi:hypothetical protein
MTRLALLLGSLLISPACAASSTWLASETTGMHKITGPFVQKDFGFSVEAPAFIPEYVANGGDANHGVLMILGDQRAIDVYPSIPTRTLAILCLARTIDSRGRRRLNERTGLPVSGPRQFATLPLPAKTTSGI